MFIDVGEEVENTVFDFPCEMDDEMMDFMFEYARENMSEETFEQMMVQWAMLDIIEKKVTETLNSLPEEAK